MKKVCTKCAEEKELEEFAKDKNKKSGYAPSCVECNKKRCKEYYHANKEKRKTYARQYLIDNKKRLWNYLLENPCVDCGESDPIVLEFDHLDPSKKEHAISRMIQKYSWENVLKEIDKCEIVCANCHRKRTAKMFKWYAFID